MGFRFRPTLILYFVWFSESDSNFGILYIQNQIPKKHLRITVAALGNTSTVLHTVYFIIYRGALVKNASDVFGGLPGAEAFGTMSAYQIFRREAETFVKR